MDKAGLVNNILSAVEAIALGRRGYATKGKEREGRVHYENGLAIAITSFNSLKPDQQRLSNMKKARKTYIAEQKKVLAERSGTPLCAG